MSYLAAKAAHLRLGLRGEKLAAKLLRAKNYVILCRNYQVRSGEIDLVARDGGNLVFVEIKTRRATTRSRPAEGLSARQKKRIYHAAQSYLRRIGNPAAVYRFDLIEIILSRFGIREIRHWENNFSKPA
ncbi:MAG: YraN family protein [Victivallaceae bacterium]|nr:YraN family protein [Victivallaceae bacterium]